MRLTAASYTLNGKKWVNVFPADGLFYGAGEGVPLRDGRPETGDLRPGARVRDAAGNIGSGDVVFTVE